MLTISGLSAASGVSVSFAPALAQITRPHNSPHQVQHIAAAGQQYIYERAANIERDIIIQFRDIPTEARTTPKATDGLDALSNLITASAGSGLNWSEVLCTVTDPDGDAETARYWSGWESFREASGRTGRRDNWTGTLVFKRNL